MKHPQNSSSKKKEAKKNTWKEKLSYEDIDTGQQKCQNTEIHVLHLPKLTLTFLAEIKVERIYPTGQRNQSSSLP